VTITYCVTWSSDQMAPVESLSEDEARARHDAGELYTAVLSDGPESPPRLVERRADGVHIARFIEQRGRDEMIYAFEPMDGRLFLVEASINTINDAGKALTTDMTVFRPDGIVEARIRDHVAKSSKSTGDIPDRDVSMCWEDIPAFGDYDSITRIER
jgi:hypothetical protein